MISVAVTRSAMRRATGVVRPAVWAALVVGLVIGVLTPAPAAWAAVAAPAPLAPANGARVVVPFTLSWSAVSDPSGIVAYNWQVSPSSTFSPVIQQDSTSGQTQDTVSGLANGTYFWRVQAVNAFEQGAWSAARSFTVTGAGPDQPGTPTLSPPKGGTTQFHPFESITFTWSSVAGAASYVFEADKNPSFPVVSTRVHFDNISATTTSIVIGDFCGGCEQGNYLARVYAVGANGNRGVPSATVGFSVFYSNPLPPPPTPLTPPNAATVTLPITFSWTEVPNPQESGYELQIARDSAFKSIEVDNPQITPPRREVLSLTSGTKFWRVRSFQGNNSPTTAAVTAWSPTATFTVSSTPPTVVSVTLTRPAPFSGEDELGDVQLSTVAPAGGAVVRLTSSDPGAVPVPASVTVPAGLAVLPSSFGFVAGQVTADTPATVTASLGSSSASFPLTVRPPSLKELTLTPTTTSGGVTQGAILMLNGQAPPGGAVVSLASSSPAVRPPATVTVPAGSPSASFTMPTSEVTTSTPVTITASWNGGIVRSQLTVMPSPAPTSLTLFPATTTGGSGSVQGTVSIASAASVDQFLRVTSDNPGVLPFLSNSVMIPAGSTRGAIQILPSAVTRSTVVTISVAGGGVTRSAQLTVNPNGTPPPAPTLSSFTVNPTSVPGGEPATGTVTLPAAAPAGGTVVALSSNLPGTASVPASVTVPPGATSATFTVTTFPAANTTVQLTARNGDTILSTGLGITTPGQATLTVTATGRSGERVTSSPTGITVAVGSTGSAPFIPGTRVTLSASNGRDVIWSGACSSAGSKVKTCAFTLNANAAVTANVQ